MTPSSPDSRREFLVRRSWWLWAITFTVVASLAAAVVMLYLPLLRHDPVGPLAGSSWYAVIGLAGLTVVFCLYTAFKQHELNATREQLEREEREKDDVRLRLSELSALFQTSTTINLQLKLEDILEIIVRRVVATLRAQQSSIMLWNPESGMLESRASYGLESEFARNARKRMGEGIAGWVAERREAVQLDARDPAAAQAPADDSREGLSRHYKSNRQITSALSLPLQVGERCVGVLNVNRINHPEPFRPHHRELLQLFANHVGAVIERAETVERLGSRTEALEADVKRLSEVNRLKDVFIWTASHELKTPLTSVIAYAELLDENEDKLVQGQRREFLGRLRAEAGRLLGLIEDILDLTRIESGKLALRPRAIVPSSMVHAAVETTRPTAERAGVELLEDHQADLPAMALDEVKMRQVVVNLLVNAVKFSPQGATVMVRTLEDHGFLRIEVEDQGVGVSPDEATHIFELFGQGAASRDPRRGGGLGIGLHLVKRISELHGGHVGVNSQPGEGSIFWVRLPLAASAVDPEPDTVAHAA